jgi:hypothetical protein
MGDLASHWSHPLGPEILKVQACFSDFHVAGRVFQAELLSAMW